MLLRHRLPLKSPELALFLAPLLLVAVIWGGLGTKRWLQEKAAHRPTPLPTPKRAYLSQVVWLAYSPSGKQFVLINREGTLSLRKSSGTLIKKWSKQKQFDCVPTFSPDGAWLAYATSGTIQLWEPASGQLIASLGNAAWDISRLAFSPDHQLLAALIDTSSPWTYTFSPSSVSSVAVWDVNTGQLVVSPRRQQKLRDANALVFSPDSKTVVVIGGIDSPPTSNGNRPPDRPVAQLWDIATRKPRWQVAIPRDALSCSFSANGKQLEVRGSTNVWLDTRTGATQARGTQYASYLHYMETATYLFQGSIVAGSYQNGNLDFLDTASGQPLPIASENRLEGMPSSFLPVTGNNFDFSPDGRRVLIATASAQLRCYDLSVLANWKQWQQAHPNQNLPAFPVRWMLDLRTNKFLPPNTPDSF